MDTGKTRTSNVFYRKASNEPKLLNIEWIIYRNSKTS